jgi:S1-C subfamily serine protease
MVEIVSMPSPRPRAPKIVEAVLADDGDDFDDRPLRRPRSERDDWDDDDRAARTRRRPTAKKKRRPIALVIAGAAILFILIGAAAIGINIWNDTWNKAASMGPTGIAGAAPDSGPGFFSGAQRNAGNSWNPILRSPNDAPTLQDPTSDDKSTTDNLTDSRPIIGPPLAKSANSSTDAAAVGETLPQEILDRVKRATVYIRVTLDKGIASGSGFFAVGAPNMVLTNAHVVDMLEPSKLAPKNIDVVLNSGEPDEATFHGEVLSVDRGSDLAVLRIRPNEAGKKTRLPEPLAVTPDARLHETQQVFVAGFPHGEQLGKNITVSKSSITSLRKSADGRLDQIQVGGGMHPGNSGGPVVDGAGHIVGVAVSVIKNTSLNFAVPAHCVGAILEGRFSEMHIGEPQAIDEQMTLKVELDALDPVQHIKTPAVDWWWGDAKAKVPARRGNAPAGAPRNSVSLKSIKPGRYAADIALPKNVPDGQVLWLQPRYTSTANETLFMQGVAKEIDPLPEPKPVTLTFRPASETARLTLKCTSRINFHTDQGAHSKLLCEMQARLSEQSNNASTPTGSLQNVVIPDQDGQFQFTMTQDGKSLPRQPDLDKALSNAKQLTLEVSVDRNGSLFRVQPAYGSAPEDARHRLQSFAGLLCRSLDLAALPFPNTEVRPGQRWRAERQVPLMTMTDDVMDVSQFEFVYRGLRKVNGRELAVVTFSGRAGGDSASGGTILVDPSQGRVVKATATVNSTMDMHMMVERELDSVHARCRLDMVLSRE